MLSYSWDETVVKNDIRFNIYATCRLVLYVRNDSRWISVVNSYDYIQEGLQRKGNDFDGRPYDQYYAMRVTYEKMGKALIIIAYIYCFGKGFVRVLLPSWCRTHWEISCGRLSLQNSMLWTVLQGLSLQEAVQNLAWKFSCVKKMDFFIRICSVDV